jgi:hypothetical protein
MADSALGLGGKIVVITGGSQGVVCHYSAHDHAALR